MPRVGGADDAHHAVPADNLAVPADLLHRCQYFHLCLQWQRPIAPSMARHRGRRSFWYPIPDHWYL